VCVGSERCKDEEEEEGFVFGGGGGGIDFFLKTDRMQRGCKFYLRDISLNKNNNNRAKKEDTQN